MFMEQVNLKPETLTNFKLLSLKSIKEYILQVEGVMVSHKRQVVEARGFGRRAVDLIT